MAKSAGQRKETALKRNTKAFSDSSGSKQLTFEDVEPVKQALVAPEQAPIAAPEQTALDKHICHGVPMRKVNLGPGRIGYKCDECMTLVVRL